MKYANLIGYSDITPYEVVRVVSAKTIEIRQMTAKLADDWKPEFIPGGFCAHCTNNNSQKYIFEQNNDSIVIRARLQKNGKWKSAFGEHRISDVPKAFYDYNF